MLTELQYVRVLYSALHELFMPNVDGRKNIKFKNLIFIINGERYYQMNTPHVS